MSYDIRVKKRNAKDGVIEDVVLRSKHDIAGHTYRLGGTDEAWINITYNYVKFFYDIWPKPNGEKPVTHPFDEMFSDNSGGIRSLYGKPIDFVIKELVRGIDHLGDEKPSQDPWEPSPGNAKLALQKLLTLCEIAKMENPDGELTIQGD